jgi:hypothetical protein
VSGTSSVRGSMRWSNFHPHEDEKMDYFDVLPRELAPSLLKENLGNMDRLTQLQDAVEKVFVTRKANFMSSRRS